LEREPLDGGTKAAGCFSPLLLFCLSVRLSFSFSSLSLSFLHFFFIPLSRTSFDFPCRVFAGSLVSSVRQPGPRILFSNYTVTCNRPCQLAAPFFRSSSPLLFFFSSSLVVPAGSGVACNPFEWTPTRRWRRA